MKVLLVSSLKHWVSARGFWLVFAAALVPFLLTGAWVVTHQKDVSATSLTWEPSFFREGDSVNFTAVFTNTGKFGVGEFNASVNVGRLVGATLRPDATEKVTLPGLEPGEKREVRLTWTARAGTYWALAQADVDDAISEIEEFNNQKPWPVAVGYRLPNATLAPKTPTNLTGTAGSSPSAEARILDIRWSPDVVKPGENMTFEVTVANDGPGELSGANVTVRVGQSFTNTLFASRETTETVTIASGSSSTVTLAWNNVQAGIYWVEAYVNVTAGSDPDAANNHLAEPFTVDPAIPADFKPPEIPEKLSIKDFYLKVLSNLHLRVLIPFIGLFYAAGVLSDEREKGTLAYLLTRPVGRWLIPLTKFAASFGVAALAIGLGILAAFGILFGAPGGNIGYLTTPLFISLVALFVYGSFFVLLGVLVDRPYIVGIAFVIGWETIAGNLVPWVKNLTFTHFINRAIESWQLDKGVQWLPTGSDSLEALRNLLIAAVLFLAAASLIMKRREFEV